MENNHAEHVAIEKARTLYHLIVEVGGQIERALTAYTTALEIATPSLTQEAAERACRIAMGGEHALAGHRRAVPLAREVRDWPIPPMPPLDLSNIPDPIFVRIEDCPTLED